MHRLPNLVTLPIRFLAISLTVLLLQSAPIPAWSRPAPQPNSSTAPVSNCIEADCSVRIAYSGQAQTWTVPAGSSDFWVELAGASGGGEHGGLGALIRANLRLTPGQVLEFRIGGAGKRGDHAPGGYNGGGRAGSGVSAAGSGGGMSQLSVSTAGSTAVLIAGGGGGAGGVTAGGNAGLVGEAGASGKDSSGGGGGQSAGGGQAGTSGRVSQEATSGRAGEGGSGASANLAVPGGGGGGGYYGGGGGGAAYGGCCQPGSGGGGGSSFINASLATNVEVSNAPVGSGYALIRFRLVPSVLAHAWSQTNSSSGELRLDFNLPVSAVRLSRVTVAGCQQVLTSPIGTAPSKAWTFSLRRCSADKLSLTLSTAAAESPSSSGGLLLGPVSDWKVELAFVATPPPKLKFQGANLFMSSNVTILLLADRPIMGFSNSDMRATGCANPAVRATSNGHEISLRDCREGQQSIRLLAQSLSDTSGNLLPTSDITFNFRVDLSAPRVSLSLLEWGDTTGVARIVLNLSEPVGSPLLQLERQLTSAGCNSDWEESSKLRYIGTISCEAPVTLEIPRDSLTDSAGRLGPSSNVTLSLAFSERERATGSADTALPPWIPVGSPSDQAEPPLADPTAVSSQTDLVDAGATGVTGWAIFEDPVFRNLSLGGLLLLALLLGVGSLRGLRLRGDDVKSTSANSRLAKNDGSLAVNKYPVFGKPAHRLG